MLTQEQVEKLNKAIDLAEGPGQCAYEDNDKPYCVIGQLAALEGVPAKKMRGWGGETIAEVLQVERNSLSNYPLELLSALQVMWDFHKLVMAPEDRIESTRRKMRSLVMRYATGQEDT